MNVIILHLLLSFWDLCTGVISEGAVPSCGNRKEEASSPGSQSGTFPRYVPVYIQHRLFLADIPTHLEGMNMSLQ